VNEYVQVIFLSEEDLKMSLELLRESVKVSRVVVEDSAQTIVEHDIIVPDVNPDVLRVLLLDGEVLEKSSEAAQDKILVEGSVRYKILYISDESEQAVKSINAVSDFSYGMDILNVTPGMKPEVRCNIEHIEYDMLNGRKINVKVILKLNAKVIESVDRDLISDIKGINDLQVLKEGTEVYCYLGENTVNCTIDEAMEIPAGKPSIKEILRNDVKIIGKDYKTSDNKIIVKGDLSILTLYIGDNEEKSIQFMEHEVPFTQFIELTGLGDNSVCEVNYRILNYTFTPGEDSDGEYRILNGEVVIKLEAQATEKRHVNIIFDAYSLTSRVSLETQPFKVNRVIHQDKCQVVLKDIISVDGDSPDISEVFNVLSKPNLFEVRTLDGTVSLEGSVNNSILYIANNTDQPVFCYNNEMPFKHSCEIKDAKSWMKCEVYLDIEHCNYSMVSENEVEIRLVVNVCIKVIDDIETMLISKVNESPIEEEKVEKQPSITIYFSQKDDSLWKIAKKYCTTMEDIKIANEFEDEGKINPGQQIVIPRKVI
jgi:hypothetical protein